MNKQKYLFIGGNVPLDDLGECIQDQLHEKEIIQLVLSIGNHGDLTYELKLLEELSKLILKIYPLNSIQAEDENFYQMLKTLKILNKQLKHVNNE